MNEIWRDVPIDGNYQVSSLGRARSKPRRVNCKGGTRMIKGKILKPIIAPSTGYTQIRLSSVEGERKVHLLHRLVALAFCEGHKDGLVVNHKNGIRHDNRASNLEWVTQSENHKHSYRELGRKNSFLGRFSSEHPTSKPVLRICRRTGERRFYESGMDAVRDGFKSDGISRACQGQIKTHYGYKWKYA